MNDASNRPAHAPPRATPFPLWIWPTKSAPGSSGPRAGQYWGIQHGAPHGRDGRERSAAYPKGGMAAEPSCSSAAPMEGAPGASVSPCPRTGPPRSRRPPCTGSAMPVDTSASSSSRASTRFAWRSPRMGDHLDPLAPHRRLRGIVAIGDVIRLKSGAWMALFHDDGRYLGGTGQPGAFHVYKTLSRDGGLTWSAPEVVTTHPSAHLCEPGAIPLARWKADRHSSCVKTAGSATR